MPMSLENSLTESKLRSPETTTASCPALSSAPISTAAFIRVAISPRNTSTSVFRRERTSSMVRPE
ncbi:hypothetical protein D3C85_1724880 [compost metagenome]